MDPKPVGHRWDRGHADLMYAVRQRQREDRSLDTRIWTRRAKQKLPTRDPQYVSRPYLTAAGTEGATNHSRVSLAVLMCGGDNRVFLEGGPI